MAEDTKKTFVTPQEKTIFIAVASLSLGGFVIAAISQKDKTIGERVRLIMIGIAVAGLLGVLSVAIPRLFTGKPTDKGIRETTTYQKVRDKFRSIGTNGGQETPMNATPEE